ncbi:hypothetical protein TNCT6_69990 [Streptomyces sp. 6-11-2]|nr:hypothetical protein TNCT6_69990 [Streptomyces sp. 6-11-2]
MQRYSGDAQSLQRAHAQPGAGVPQRGRGHPRQRQGVKSAGELAPGGRVAAFLEQRGREQQVDHPPPGWEFPQPLLHSPALGEDLVDHLERHGLSHLAQMTRGEDAFGYRDLTGDDRLSGQRSLRSL